MKFKKIEDKKKKKKVLLVFELCLRLVYIDAKKITTKILVYFISFGNKQQTNKLSLQPIKSSREMKGICACVHFQVYIFRRREDLFDQFKLGTHTKINCRYFSIISFSLRCVY